MGIITVGKSPADIRLNALINDRSKNGWIKKYTTSSDPVALSMASIGGKKAVIWDDGRVTVDEVNIGSVTVSDNRYDMTSVPVQIRNAVSGIWERQQGIYIQETATSYYITATSLQQMNIAKSATPIPGTPPSIAGDIKAGTYEYVAVELTSFGAKSVFSTKYSITLSVDSDVNLSVLAKANAGAVSIMFYRSDRNRTIEQGAHYVGSVACIAAGPYLFTDNTPTEELGLPLEISRELIPVGGRFSTVHKGRLAIAGFSLEPSVVYFTDVSNKENGLDIGYVDFGAVSDSFIVPNGEAVTGLQSVGNEMIVFTANSIWMYHGTPGRDENNIPNSNWQTQYPTSAGLDRWECVYQFNSQTFFLGTTHKNCYSMYHDQYGELRLRKLNKEDLLDQMYFKLVGLSNKADRFETELTWLNPIVFPDAESGKIYFGGEIKTAVYDAAGSWTTNALDANPQQNRQYVFRVWEPDMLAEGYEGDLYIFTDVMASVATVVDNITFFADRFGNVNQIVSEMPYEAYDSEALFTQLQEASTGAVITHLNAFTATAIVGAPLRIYKGDGSVILRYVLSSTDFTFTVDRDTVIADGDYLLVGCSAIDYTLVAMAKGLYVPELRFLVGGLQLREHLGVIAFHRDLSRDDPIFTQIFAFEKILVAKDRHYVNVSGLQSQYRFVLPSLYNRANPFPLTLVGIDVSGQEFKDGDY